MIGRRARRAPGRHRDGQAPTKVHRRLWDGPARSEAERLGRVWPGWVVLYSLGNRRFYAIAAWPAPEPLIVDAGTAEELEERMRDAETAFVWLALPAPPALPAQNRRDGVHSQVPAVAPLPSRRPYQDAA
ncbi:hypothetical protein GCM10017673_35280 [Streptosporangium violaceochromogenes]|nr:hypothetical protein GCM10017673_35280 [Streptosporangium violaceochromogenes]